MPVPTSNLALRYTAGVGITASSGRVTDWADQTGNGHHGTQSTEANRPYDTVDAGGAPVVLFPWANSHPACRIVVPTSLSGMNTRALTVICVCTRSAFEAGVLFSVNTAAAQTFASFNIPSNSPARVNFLGTPSASLYAPLNKAIYAWSGRASGSTCRYNNTIQACATPTSVTSMAGGMLGAAVSGSTAFSGGVYDFLIYNADITDTVVTDAVGSLEDEHDVVMSYQKRYVGKGDSITMGSRSTMNLNYMNQLILNRHTDWEAFNVGVASQRVGPSGTAGTMTNIASTQVDVLYDGTKQRNVCVLMGGTNDVVLPTSGDTVAGYVDTFIGGRDTTGFENWYITQIDRGSTYRAEMDELNSTVRAGGYTGLDRIIDAGRGSALPNAFLDNSDGRWDADGIHPNNTGYADLANFVSPYLNASGNPQYYLSQQLMMQGARVA